VKALVQRVIKASVTVREEVVGQIGEGLVVLLGVANGDTEKDADYLVNKFVNLRIFMDAEDKMNRSVLDVKGEILLISQFTLLADSRHGRRPAFTGAAPPDEAQKLFNYVVAQTQTTGVKVATGRFQQHMEVEIHNSGPVTIMLDSKDKYQ
jgi:D-tyrosyl-tRNA(Tyr) deacylase